VNDDDAASGRRRLVQRLRETLVPVLSEGSWDKIADDHRNVDLAWRPDFEPGWGKPKYVRRVLDDLADNDVIAVARRALDRLSGRFVGDVENALAWIESNGVAHISEVTRIALANALEGPRLHPTEGPGDVLNRFARGTGSTSYFYYAEDGALVETEADPFGFFGTGPHTVTKSSYLALFDAYGFRRWPDARLFRLIEFLVHPTVRRDSEQASLVQVVNGVLAADRFELFAGELLSGHAVFKVRPTPHGVAGRPKNLVFASTGPKPELGFADAVNNDIVILRHAEHCLIFDEPITEEGLRWTPEPAPGA
jgi:hypothetical protein